VNSVFKKLQYKDQDRIYIQGAPAEFEPALDEMRELTEVSTISSGKRPVGFAMFFVKNCAEIAKTAPKAVARVEDDGLLWFAYPKKSSKRYSSDIGRDDSWLVLGDLGFEAVRQIAIDDDWSALRFRRVEHIKTLKRDPKRAMTEKGKKRTRR